MNNVLTKPNKKFKFVLILGLVANSWLAYESYELHKLRTAFNAIQVSEPNFDLKKQIASLKKEVLLMNKVQQKYQNKKIAIQTSKIAAQQKEIQTQHKEIETQKQKIAQLNGEIRTLKVDKGVKVDKEVVEKILLKNPEIVIQSIAEYRFQEEQNFSNSDKEVIHNNYEKLYQNTQDPYIGNKNGTQLMVEFIDYNCDSCKRFSKTAQKLVANNPNLKIIIKEFPVFGETSGSPYGAKIANALFLKYPKKYYDFHKLLIDHTGDITSNIIKVNLKRVGVTISDLEPLLKDSESNIANNKILAEKIGVTSTPSVFLGNEKINQLSYEEIQKKLDSMNS